MEDRELLDAIREIAAEADPRWECWGHSQWLGGTPPLRAVNKITGFAEARGYKVVRTTDLGPDAPESVMGCVVGAYIPPELPQANHLRMTMRLRKGMSPAREFEVATHEAAHIALGHPLHDPVSYMREFIAREPYRQMGSMENIPYEISCELAAAAIARLVRIPDDKQHKCYLSSRLRQSGMRITEEMIWAAYLAARKIANIAL